MIEPGLFVGTLRHRRHEPVAHAFTYPLFMVLLDIDRLPELMGVSRLTSYNRWNWASFSDHDHLGDTAETLREGLTLDATNHGIELPDGPVFLLTHLRYLGHCFNPVSFFYCFDAADNLKLVLAEVSNTFGGAHNYWLRPDSNSRTFRAAAQKSLYVSPFMPVDLDYTFAFTPPTRSLVAHMESVRAGSACFDATLSLKRRPWNATEIRRALLRYPMMTANVVARIHWQALTLWWKGVPPVRRATRDGVGERAAWDAHTRGPVDGKDQGMLKHWAKTVFLSGLRGLRGGTLTLECPDGTQAFGDDDGLHATLVVRDERFFLRALTGSDIGIGESFMDGDWTTPDLVPLARLMMRNRQTLSDQSALAGSLRRLAGGIARRLRNNSVAGSRRHIHRHYDLGNDFFRLFLDAELHMYSCGYFESADDSLEEAQMQKVDRACRTLALTPADRVLEIGSGWGGFAVWAATRYGCHVTTTTISDEQYRHVREWRSRLGEAGSRIDVLRSDYRELTGEFDKIVSIEMFEAVGLNHYDDYFTAVDRLLAPDGSMFLQTITVDDQWFPNYHGTPDWIETYIFPGGELASVGEVMKSLARSSSLSVYHLENCGTHYARTLRAWRHRFHENLDAVRALGFDGRFIRMWDLYLASCEAAFLERHTGLFRMLLLKNGSRQTLFNEPWSEVDAGPKAGAESAA